MSLEARAAPAHLVVSASSFQVVLADETIGDELDYFEPTELLAAAFTDVFGREPETVDGIQVGDPVAVLEVANPSHRWQRTGREEPVIKVNSVPVTTDDNERAFSVELRSFPSNGPVT
ncbi:hypothetical protein [Cryobacterium sp. Y11]|uniref:hypothetical protein n=1 Tax=Cryobacterium sp. Y11 TaxID=2045016 RepID=UPI0011B0AE34|nr:hypothetical protein [Cryobacterium sp. Y11]